MRELKVDNLIIGGGLAGIGIALGLSEAGEDYLLVDSNESLGGVLKYFLNDKLKELGDETVAFRKPLNSILNLITSLSESNEALRETSVLKLSERKALAVSKESGGILISFSRVFLATGARDASKWELLILGDNTYGVYTTKMALYMLSRGLKIGNRIVVYGAKPLTRYLFTILKSQKRDGKIESVDLIVSNANEPAIENIPVIRGTILETRGKKRLNSIIVRDIEGEESEIECDTLILGEKTKPKDYLLRKSNFDIEAKKENRVLDNIYLCGGITRDYDYIDDTFYDCYKLSTTSLT